MKWLIIFISLFVLVILQSAGSTLIIPFSFANLLLIFSLVSVLLSETKEMIGVTIISALLLDFSSGLTDGVIALSFTLTILTVYIAVNWFFTKEYKFMRTLVLVGVSTVFFLILVLIINRSFDIFNLGHSIDLNFLFSRKIWLELALNFLFTWPVVYFYLKVNKFIKWIHLK
jgi:hypothetical protein